MIKITIQEVAGRMAEGVMNGQPIGKTRTTIVAEKNGRLGVEPDELAGVLLVAYMQAAEAFLNMHPIACTRCAAYQLHNSNFHRTNHLYKELLGNKDGYKTQG